MDKGERPLGKEVGTTPPNFWMLASGSRRFAQFRLAIVVIMLPPLFMMASAQGRPALLVLPSPEPLQVFSGEGRSIPLVLSNSSDQTIEMDVHARIFQTTSGTAAPWAQVPWKRLRLFGHQVVLESARLDFPWVRADTRFVVHWVDNTNGFLGLSAMRVYPPDLLKKMKTLAGDEPILLHDPEQVLESPFKAIPLSTLVFEEAALAHFQGRLAIFLCPNSSAPAGMITQLKHLARRGVGVVWIQVSKPDPSGLKPFHSVFALGKGAIVLAQPILVANFADSPGSQLNLLALCRLALHPSQPQLPD